jgi:hypothetical protein
MRRGLAARTAVLVLSVKEGRFRFEHPHAKDCVPVFKDGDPALDVEELVWSYQYDAVEADEEGRPVSKRYQFRRDYSTTHVTEYEPALLEHGKRIEWRVLKQEPHGFTRCPVIWVRNLAEDCGDSIDGVSIYDGLLDEFDALNRSLSQRHQGLEILGTPQPYEVGVGSGDGPGPAGRTASPRPTESKAPKDTYSNARTAATQPARKTGAAHMWSYGGSDVELGLLETTGKAFEVATAHVNDIRSRVLEAMNVILLDPTAVAGKGDMSAKALSLMYAPMLALVDEIREWWWERCIGRVLEMMLEIVATLPPGSVLVRGGDRVAALLAGRRVALLDGTEQWFAPLIQPLWGEYFAPSAEEAKQTVETAAMAKEKGLVSGESATRYIANHFSIDSVEDEVAAAEEEKVAAQEAAMEQTIAVTEAGAVAKAGAAPPGGPGPKKAKPPAAVPPKAPKDK